MIKYPVEAEKDEVRTAGIGLPISAKSSILICRKINRMETAKAKEFLQDVIDKKRCINRKYPIKACQEILRILESAEKNAENKGLENTVIRTICAEKGSNRMRMKRRRSFGSRLKNTNIKVIVKGGKGVKDEHKAKVRGQ